MNGRFHVSVIVLAAGTASRMGRPKQLARLGGVPILVHVLRTVREAGLKDIIVVLGSSAEEIKKEVVLEGFRVVENSAYNQGISSSIHLGLSQVAIETSAVLILLADQPLVLPSTLTRLIAEYGKSRPQAAIPTYQGRPGNPVLLDRSLFDKAGQLKGDEGFRSILRASQNVIRIEVDDPGILLDVDTPEDLERCQLLYSERNPST
ncbi:MAG: nucleotidyltransferase family protein [Candidatus Acidiferrales bacterium]